MSRPFLFNLYRNWFVYNRNFDEDVITNKKQIKGLQHDFCAVKIPTRSPRRYFSVVAGRFKKIKGNLHGTSISMVTRKQLVRIHYTLPIFLNKLRFKIFKK